MLKVTLRNLVDYRLHSIEAFFLSLIQTSVGNLNPNLQCNPKSILTLHPNFPRRSSHCRLCCPDPGLANQVMWEVTAQIKRSFRLH